MCLRTLSVWLLRSSLGCHTHDVSLCMAAVSLCMTAVSLCMAAVSLCMAAV